jgi:hypothetical protein
MWGRRFRQALSPANPICSTAEYFPTERTVRRRKRLAKAPAPQLPQTLAKCRNSSRRHSCRRAGPAGEAAPSGTGLLAGRSRAQPRTPSPFHFPDRGKAGPEAGSQEGSAGGVGDRSVRKTFGEPTIGVRESGSVISRRASCLPKRIPPAGGVNVANEPCGCAV